MIEDLVAWLLGQVARDEQTIRAMTNALGGLRSRWSAGRLLAECDAKRRILERHAPRVGKELADGDLICGCSDFYEVNATPWPCDDVRDVASVYAGCSGYREEWGPADTPG